MDFRQYLTIEEDCACCRPEGTLTLRDCLRVLEGLAFYCRANGVTRVLFDKTRVVDREIATGLDVFQFGIGLAQSWPTGLRLVILCSPESIDSGRFAQTVARNRGFSFGLFDDESLARNWLNRPGLAPASQTTAHSIDVFRDNS